MAALWFVGAILIAVWLGTWVLQIAAWMVVIAARILFWVVLGISAIVAIAFQAVTDPLALQRAYRDQT